MPDKNSPPQHHAGEVIDRCTFIAVLGFGGHAEVWSVRDGTMNEDHRAFKSLDKAVTNRETQKRFLMEATAMGRLTHPNILRIYRTVEEGTVRGIVMQLVDDGRTLAHMLERSQPSAHEALRVLRDICSALVEAHAHGIVHRDMKPDNVLLQLKNGVFHILVSDFGIALISNQGERFTKVFGSMGTPRYMAPEQHLEKTSTTPNQIDVRCDVYSLSMMLYELFSGNQPPLSFALAIKETREAYLEKLPADIAAIVRRGGSYLVTDRHPSVSEFLADLDRAFAQADPDEEPWTPRAMIELPVANAPGTVAVEEIVDEPPAPAHRPTIVSIPPEEDTPSPISPRKPRPWFALGTLVGLVLTAALTVSLWPHRQIEAPVETPPAPPIAAPTIPVVSVPVAPIVAPAPIAPVVVAPIVTPAPVPVLAPTPYEGGGRGEVKIPKPPPPITVASLTLTHPPASVHAGAVVPITVKLAVPKNQKVASVTLRYLGSVGGAKQHTEMKIAKDGTTATGSFTASPSLGASVTLYADMRLEDDPGTPVKSVPVDITITP